MVIQPFQRLGGRNAQGETDELLTPALADDESGVESSMQGYFTYPLVLQCAISDTDVDLHMFYDSNAFKDVQLSAMAHQFEQVMGDLLVDSETRLLSDVRMASEWDVEKAREFNFVEFPYCVDRCMHEVVEELAHRHPNAPALYGWDAQFSYGQLNATANALAHYLVENFDMKPGKVVHVCFEKSAWYLVAILAVNKAGSAWSPIDPAHPLERKKGPVKRTGSDLIIAAPEQVAECLKIVDQVIDFSPDFVAGVEKRFDVVSPPNTTVQPSDVAYILFTSGSTGIPKGFVIEHRSLCSSQKAVQERVGGGLGVRILQFAAFVFDLSIGKIFGGLMHGGCLCIPSETDRMGDITKFIRESKASWAYLTPSFTRTLNPDDVPSINTLFFAGEAVPADEFQKWFKTGRRVINAWGPAEATVYGTFYTYGSLNDSPNTIGHSVGCKNWIVDVNDDNRLAPIGTVGEIWIQGPNLLREYLGDPEKTKSTVLSDLPAWASDYGVPRLGRFYKTGDLGYYNADGTIEFVSRKDTQVKIRGLRVELGEVEHHIRIHLRGLITEVGVDVLRTSVGVTLTAYLCFSGEYKTGEEVGPVEGMFAPPDAEFQARMRELVGYLSLHLPNYMVPTLFILCSYMPFVTSTKLDRKRLRDYTAQLEAEKLSLYALQDAEKESRLTLRIFSETRVLAASLYALFSQRVLIILMSP